MITFLPLLRPHQERGDVAMQKHNLGQLKRVNLPGIDLIGEDGHT